MRTLLLALLVAACGIGAGSSAQPAPCGDRCADYVSAVRAFYGYEATQVVSSEVLVPPGGAYGDGGSAVGYDVRVTLSDGRVINAPVVCGARLPPDDGCQVFHPIPEQPSDQPSPSSIGG